MKSKYVVLKSRGLCRFWSTREYDEIGLRIGVCSFLSRGMKMKVECESDLIDLFNCKVMNSGSVMVLRHSLHTTQSRSSDLTGRLASICVVISPGNKSVIISPEALAIIRVLFTEKRFCSCFSGRG